MTKQSASQECALIVAAPRSGKTEFALKRLIDALPAQPTARMVVSNRQVADELSNRVIREVGVLDQTRPVTTLQAVAFRIIAGVRAKAGAPAPKLLNGAEQDMLLRRTMAVHLQHAEHGDSCSTCDLLRDYFAQKEWDAVIQDAQSRKVTSQAGGSTSVEEFARGISAAFISQLRDMMARLDELGVTADDEPALLDIAKEDARLSVQWRLAFALRREYIEAQARAYAGEYRLDSSYLFVAGVSAVARAGKVSDGDAAGLMPALLIVDDFQDITLAGLRFLEALHDAGVQLVLLGNPDESVQTFRGSYPEDLFRMAQEGPLQAQLRTLDSSSEKSAVKNSNALEVLASRVSMSIGSVKGDQTPIAQRPGKLTASIDGGKLPDDDSLKTALYRSAHEELDDVVWRMKRRHLDEGVDWNDMALIAHDNVTVRLFGERLRRDGVPVRYSQITRLLKDEPFVCGLFALVELAQLRAQGVAECHMSLPEAAAYAKSRVITLMGSTLVTAGATNGRGLPARVEPMQAAVKSLESLAPLAGVTGNGSTVDQLMQAWSALSETYASSHQPAESGEGVSVSVDDTLLDSAGAAGGVTGDGDAAHPLFNANALYAMLAFDEECAPAATVIGAIDGVMGKDPQRRAFDNLCSLIDTTTRAIESLPEDQRDVPQYALYAAWDAAGVAKLWQETALNNTADGRTANDRLDAAMYLFQQAADASDVSVTTFIDQVRGMEVQADSLAKFGPVEQAVTLTTPAGTAGRHWAYVWVPSVQQKVWPNLAERNTMFGGEDLVQLVLHGELFTTQPGESDPRLTTVLTAEKKSFLVALTRGDTQVTLSAVRSEKLTPSDFLYGFLPERFTREDDVVYTAVGSSAETADSQSAGDYHGLDTDPRGLVTAARVALATHEPGSPEFQDAQAALALLRDHGLIRADPEHWPFLRGDDEKQTQAQESQNSDEAPVVTLSPSGVDGLWACPVCWMMENRFSGPTASTAAANFGTIIHAVAQQGSAEGLDRLGTADAAELAKMGLDETSTSDQRIEVVTNRLYSIYENLKSDIDGIDDTKQRYEALRKDATARSVLGNLASYFVLGGSDDYLESNKFHKDSKKRDVGFEIGQYEDDEDGKRKSVECEKEFAARFTLDDIRAAYIALDEVTEPVSRTQFMALLGELVGGWPEGMREDIVVRLSGRIDRLEHRCLADGSKSIRLIDYKTGKVPGLSARFSDLQLVCYQLGLAFPETADGTASPHDADAMDAGQNAVLNDEVSKYLALTDAPVIKQSALFHVAEHAAPAQSHAPEGVFQPPLFVNGAINNEPFVVRYYYGELTNFTADIPGLNAEQMPEHLNDIISEEQWKQFASFNGTQTWWALAMIARVFYAAAAVRSANITAHPQSTHVEYCRMKSACPACATMINTVLETRQA